MMGPHSAESTEHASTNCGGRFSLQEAAFRHESLFNFMV